jgi:hypothetical protein
LDVIRSQLQSLALFCLNHGQEFLQGQHYAYQSQSSTVAIINQPDSHALVSKSSEAFFGDCAALQGFVFSNKDTATRRKLSLTENEWLGSWYFTQTFAFRVLDARGSLVLKLMDVCFLPEFRDALISGILSPKESFPRGDLPPLITDTLLEELFLTEEITGQQQHDAPKLAPLAQAHTDDEYCLVFLFVSRNKIFGHRKEEASNSHMTQYSDREFDLRAEYYPYIYLLFYFSLCSSHFSFYSLPGNNSPEVVLGRGSGARVRLAKSNRTGAMVAVKYASPIERSDTKSAHSEALDKVLGKAAVVLSFFLS